VQPCESGALLWVIPHPAPRKRPPAFGGIYNPYVCRIQAFVALRTAFIMAYTSIPGRNQGRAGTKAVITRVTIHTGT
jgi:hypothetical protein